MMQVPFSFTSENGVVCDTANVYLAVSSGVAVRLVPVDSDGVEYQEGASAFVGRAGDPATDEFLSAVNDALAVLLAGGV